LKKRGTIIAVAALAMVLLVSAGIAIAAGTPGEGRDTCAEGDGGKRYGEASAAGDALSFECLNAGEEERIRAENCAGENGTCDVDCDQEKLRERVCDGECDGTCDGDSTQSRKGWSEQPAEGSGAAGPQSGECAGDCYREQLRLDDGTCDGEGTQGQSRGGN